MKKFHYAPEASGDTLMFLIGNPWALLVLYLLLINLVTFLIFGLDKWKAKRKEKKETVRRIPEKTLLLLSAFGGSIAMFVTMLLIRHKTKHVKFMLGIPLIMVIQACAVYLLFHFGVL